MRIHSVDGVVCSPATATKSRRCTVATSVLSTCVLLALCPNLALADDWINPGTGDWFLGSNWADGTVPTAVDDANIDNGGNSLVPASDAVARFLRVGDGQRGELTISGGGKLSGQAAYLGASDTGNGTITINGIGSLWQSTQFTFIGQSGSGSLSILSGGHADLAGTSVGENTGSIGNIVINGSGSSASSTSLYIGNGGFGALDIINGGANFGGGKIGILATGSGSVMISGVNSTWQTNGYSVTVAESGHGILQILNGGKVYNGINGKGTIGASAGSVGSALVDGVGSTWTNGNSLVIGDTGSGELIMRNGALVSALIGAVGGRKGGVGSLVVDGIGTSLTFDSTFFVGAAGDGVLNIINGGSVNNMSNGVIGDSLGSGRVVVSGSGSTWNNSGGLIIGKVGTGDLTIDSGGMISDKFADVAQFLTRGDVVVDGIGSSWVTRDDLRVAFSGTASLSVRNGGIVTSGHGAIGANPEGTGTVIIDGVGSRWSIGTGLDVADYGTGDLTVRSGGVIEVGGGDGTVIVAANNRDFGSGRLNIGSGDIPGFLRVSTVEGGIGSATLTFNHNSPAYYFTRDGSVTGTSVLITGSIAVSQIGTGTTVLTGTHTYTGATTVSDGLLRVDGSITSTSSANVVRGALTLENGGELTVDNGTGTLFLGTPVAGGTLNIGNGGSIGLLHAASVESLSNVFPPGTVNFNHDNPDYFFSSNGTSGGTSIEISGTAAVNQIGTGSTTLTGNHTYTGETTVDGGTMRIVGAVTATSRLDVGKTGEGVLHVVNGGTINAQDGSIGTNLGGFGTVLIDGTNSAWTNETVLDVGSFGRGALTISRGGRVVGSLTSVGLFNGSEGSVVVDGAGSFWSNTRLNVGNQGSGTLLIRSGGRVSTRIGEAGGGGHGVVVVDGTGSAWTDMDSLTVGGSGDGTLSIRNGGVVSNFGSMIGQGAGGVGSVTVSENGSTWNNDGSMDVGFSGSGNLLISEGAAVNASDVRIGTFDFGVVTVAGSGSIFASRNIIDIGSIGNGILHIKNGAVVRSVEGRAGFFPSGSGVITIEGAGSTWNNSGSIFRVGNGTVTLDNGGKLIIADGAGPLQLSSGGAVVIDGLVAAGILNASSVVATGAAVLNFKHNAVNYSFTKDATPNGEPVLIRGGTMVNQTGSGTTTLTGAHTYTGATTINAGTLRVNGSITSSTSVNNGGTLGGNGSVAAVSVANGGALAPGSAVGTLTTGTLTLANGSRLNFELGTPSAASDRLVVNGALVLDGVLNIQAVAGFTPGTYRLIDYSGALTDNTLNVSSLPAGFVAIIDTTTPGQVNLVVTSGRPAGNQAPTGEVIITGAPREGATVSATNTLADADGLGAFSYQWFLDDAAIEGANSATLRLDDLAVGKMLRVAISYTDGQGFAEQVSSTAVGPVAPAGTNLPFQKRLFFVNPADNPNQQTFIRLVNPNDADVAVQIQGFDDNGTRAPGGEVVLMLSAQQSLQLNATDLELGNAGKGLDGALGDGIGKWQLKVNSSLPIEAMSLIRTPDGFLTSVTETVPTETAGVHVLYFANPGSNPNQQSFIRVVNRSSASGEVNISAVDDAGMLAPGGDIHFTLAANAALNFNAEDYTNGNPAKGLQGAFGTGTGKWQLTVSSALNLEVMSLIRTPDGFLTDLSNIAPRAAPSIDSDRLLLSVVSGNNADQQGLIRLVNRGGLAEHVTLSAIDDEGLRAPASASIEVAPFAALQLLASELEQGSRGKGLVGAFGSGQGRWQINATPREQVEVQSLLRVPGGFLTNLSARAPRESQFEARLWIFNPGSNDQQRSILRLINRSDATGVALIEAIDDQGQPAPGGSVSLDIAPRSAVELNALELEAGNPAKGLIGALGDGAGKWRLRISADVEIEVQGLLETPAGFLTNLSSTVQ